MKNKIKQAGFKTITAFAEYIGKTRPVVYRWFINPPVMADRLLDALLRVNELENENKELRELLKASRKGYFDD